MLELIKSISERCYNAAVKRGKDVTENGCLLALLTEMIELSQALSNNTPINPLPLYEIHNHLSDDYFVTAYSQLHNTIADEMADVISTLATCYHVEVDKNLLAEAVESFKEGLTPDIMDMVEASVMLKMRYNELRED